MGQERDNDPVSERILSKEAKCLNYFDKKIMQQITPHYICLKYGNEDMTIQARSCPHDYFEVKLRCHVCGWSTTDEKLIEEAKKK